MIVCKIYLLGTQLQLLFTACLFHYNMNFGRKDETSYQSKKSSTCKRKVLPWKKTLGKRDHTCFSSMNSFNLSHLFLEARNLCLQSRGSNYSQSESCFPFLSESSQKCLCAYFYRYHLLTVLQLISTHTYRKTATGEPFRRHNEELVILRYMLTQTSLPS